MRGPLALEPEIIELWAGIAARYPLLFLEDGLAESDWDGWEQLTEQLGDRLQLVGDDIFATDRRSCARG